MRRILEWATHHVAGINILLLMIIAVGAFSFFTMRRETFPNFQLDVLLVSVPYPGATPDEVESSICQRIEEVLQPLSGIKKITSICREGSGFTLAELDRNVRDPQKVLSEVRSAVDRVSVFFPERSEKHTVEQITFRSPAIRVAVISSEELTAEAEWRLREYAETVRDRLIEQPNISLARVDNAKPYQIDVEVDESALQKYGLTLGQVAQLLRRENIELPSGQIKSDGQEILLRGKNKREFGEGIEELPVLTQSNGTVLRVRDIGEVKDAFDDVTAITEINGRPGVVIVVERTSSEDLLKISDEVHKVIANVERPEGYKLVVWGDESTMVRDRLNMLLSNGTQGGVIVFLLLALFLSLRLAFWVAMGIPISLAGAGIVLSLMDQTLNMLTMFAFLMAVGIVVDDGIVIGENIHAHRKLGKSNLQAALDGVLQVLPSVCSSISTTIICFMPLFYVSGVMGKFIAVMPAAVIAMLLFSLVEASVALPSHMAHEQEESLSTWGRLQRWFARRIQPIESLLAVITGFMNDKLDRFATNVYAPLLRFCLHYPGVPLAFLVLFSCTAVAFVRSGKVPFIFFPELDGTTIIGQVIYPAGTPASLTLEATQRMEAAIRRLSERIDTEERAANRAITPLPTDEREPKGPVTMTILTVGSAMNAASMTGDSATGSNVGQVIVQLHESKDRNVTCDELIRWWREEAGYFPGAERVVFQSANIGPGGKPLEFKLLGSREKAAELDEAVEYVKKELALFTGVSDIRDDSDPGKYEFQFRIKERAQSLGLTESDLSETIRNAYYGAEVMRLQRGRHEVKLMVRYPIDERRSLADFQELKVRGPDGVEIPILELAEIDIAQGYSEVNRVEQLRSVTISADIDITKTSAKDVASNLNNTVFKELATIFPSVKVRWEGQQQETLESFQSMVIGFAVALLGMYVLLSFEFKSYIQPFIVLLIIPFSFAGAVYGHALMGLPFTLFSMFGLVSLAGVVVNDSIVMVDFINHHYDENLSLHEALMRAGSRRLRAVFLTSATTVAGLTPMLLETSLQAQVLIPMATSLAFGLLASTTLVLFQVPVFYQFYGWMTEDASEPAPVSPVLDRAGLTMG